MSTSHGTYHVYTQPAPKVFVVRFFEPDLRRELDGEPIETCLLYRDIEATVLRKIGAKDSVVLNFGLVDRFPTAFYRLLLALRERLKNQAAHLLMCNFSSDIQEGLQILGAQRTFEIFASEDKAVYQAQTHA